MVRTNSKQVVLKSYLNKYDCHKPMKGSSFKIPEDEWEVFCMKARRFTRGNKLALFRIMIKQWEPKPSDIITDDNAKDIDDEW